jgi:putative transposase
MLRKTSHSAFQGDRRGDRPEQYRPSRFLHEHLAAASPDLLREMFTTFLNALMSAEVDAICGAPYGTSGPARSNVRNGYRHREFDTRTGTLECW